MCICVYLCMCLWMCFMDMSMHVFMGVSMYVYDVDVYMDMYVLSVYLFVLRHAHNSLQVVQLLQVLY